VDFVCMILGLGAGQHHGPSSLSASMSTMAALLEGRIETADANGVRWGPILHWLPLCHISQS
jgi:hypothetical protein